jgi:perosamine synthetase
MPDLGGNEEAYVLEALRSTWISSTGAFVDRFEREFAAFAATRAAISVSNGTAALHLLLATLELGRRDEVIVPSLTFIATANAVSYLGGRPVFVDVDPLTWCLDPAAVERSVTPRTKGIIAVHLYGHPADMDAINDVAARKGLWVIEDAAQAHGARYKERAVGGLSTAGAFSFHGNKILAGGEGGAIVLDDPALEARARLLRGQGMDPGRRYFFPVIGYNFRLTNIACAILCAQLERAPSMIARRRRVFERYRARLAGVPGIGFQPTAAWAEPAPWMFCITVDKQRFGRSRDELMERLQQANIETRPFFLPVHSLPPYRAAGGSSPQDLPVTTRLASQGVSLPSYAALAEADVDRVADAIQDAARREAGA